MPVSDRLYSDLNTKRHEVGEIYKAGESLARSIDQLVQDFIERYGGDLDETMGGINDSLADLIDGVAKPKLREMEDIEHRIADAERADLMRSSPVCI